MGFHLSRLRKPESLINHRQSTWLGKLTSQQIRALQEMSRQVYVPVLWTSGCQNRCIGNKWWRLRILRVMVMQRLAAWAVGGALCYFLMFEFFAYVCNCLLRFTLFWCFCTCVLCVPLSLETNNMYVHAIAHSSKVTFTTLPTPSPQWLSYFLTHRW